MNKDRRKEIERIAEMLNETRYALVVVAEAEREAFDNMPESLQDGERGQAIDLGATELEDLVAELEAIDQRLLEIVG